MKKVIITGATGMIGNLVLQHCLQSDKIIEVISIGRRSIDIKHAKLNEIIRKGFENYDDISEEFNNRNL